MFSGTFHPGWAQSEVASVLRMGLNLGGLFDWGTELPFVDLMRNAREWYTKDVGNPEYPWNSERAAALRYRDDGYPTEIPQRVPGSPYPQRVATIWAVTDGWPLGVYTVLFDGRGELEFNGSVSRVRLVRPGKMEFTLTRKEGGQVEMVILRSEATDPIRNIRVLLPGAEAHHLEQPFNPLWLERVRRFHTVRFMDWGHTNDWGRSLARTDGRNRVAWSQRTRMDHYTWTVDTGIPYEMMVRLMNDHDLDGWVCIPHRASVEYAEEMGRFFARHLRPGRRLFVEYSNEVWNWIFEQAHWLDAAGDRDLPWPERIVPIIQESLDAFTRGFGGPSPRLVRVVCIQTGWLDVSRRIVQRLRPGSVDAVGAAWYFGFSEEADAALDRLGARATEEEIDRWVRVSWENEKRWIRAIRDEVARPANLPLVFYEGGQHLTAHPFGQEPSWSEALLRIQRSPRMQALYRDWLTWVASLHRSGEPPLELMHFSFVYPLSAKYGSWGLLERLDQDFGVHPAPKWSALEPYLRSPRPLSPGPRPGSSSP